MAPYSIASCAEVPSSGIASGPSRNTRSRSTFSTTWLVTSSRTLGAPVTMAFAQPRHLIDQMLRVVEYEQHVERLQTGHERGQLMVSARHRQL